MRHIGIAVVLGTVLLLGTLIAGSVLILQNARQTALHAAGMGLENSASVVASAVNRQLLQVDGALVSLPSLFTAADSDQKPEIDPNLAGRLLRALNFETFPFRDLLLVSPDGTIWAAARPRPTNLPLPLPPPDASAAALPGATVEGPIYNSVTGGWSWYLTARSVCGRWVGCKRWPKYLSRPLSRCSRPCRRCPVSASIWSGRMGVASPAYRMTNWKLASSKWRPSAASGPRASPLASRPGS